MKNIINYYKNLKPRNRIIIIIGFIFFIFSIIVIITSNNSNQPSIITQITNQTSTTTPSSPEQPITVPSSEVLQIPTPTQPPPFPTPKLNISWKQPTSPESINKLNEFINTSSITSTETQKNLSTNLGFSNSDKSNNGDSKLLLWSKDENTLVINLSENSIFYSSTSTPPATGPILSKDESFVVGRQIISKIFGQEIEKTLINQNVVYYRTFRVYASPSAADKSDLIRVSFYQTIDKYPVVSLSETGGIFTLYIDRNNNLHSMSVKGGYRTISKSNELNITPFTEIQKMTDLAIRINASPDLASNFSVASNKELFFTSSKAQIAYMLIGNRYAPVYLLSGSLRGTTAPIQEGLYVIPASK